MPMKLVLTAIHIKNSPRAVPLGPAMLASSLKKELHDAVETSIIDLHLGKSPTECAEIILRQHPDCIGFSTYVWNRALTVQIAEQIKKTNPNIVLFAGGPEISACEGDMIHSGPIDFMLPGESEIIITQAMNHLINGGSPETIPEIITPAPVKDLASLPSPILDGTLDPKKYTGMLWELSRGCLFQCDFCYESRGTPGIRRFTSERLREELRIFKKAKVEQIFVLDPTFNSNKDTAKEMLHMFLDEAPEIYYFFEVRSEFIDKEMAELFASLICSLQVGIQSSSVDVLKNINRSIDTNDFEEKMLLLYHAGACYGFDLIYGLPGDSIKGFCSSLDYAFSLAPNHVDIFPLTVLPGTKLQETAPSFGLKHLKDNPYTVTSSPEFSEADMKLAETLAEAVNIFYNKGKAIPWFASIKSVIDITPSTFFKQFSEWVKANPDDNIMSLQKQFTAHLYREHKKDKLIPIACDIITYFGATEGMSSEPTFSFIYNPSAILDCMVNETTDLEELYHLLPESKCEISIEKLSKS